MSFRSFFFSSFFNHESMPQSIQFTNNILLIKVKITVYHFLFAFMDLGHKRVELGFSFIKFVCFGGADG